MPWPPAPPPPPPPPTPSGSPPPSPTSPIIVEMTLITNVRLLLSAVTRILDRISDSQLSIAGMLIHLAQLHLENLNTTATTATEEAQCRQVLTQILALLKMYSSQRLQEVAGAENLLAILQPRPTPSLAIVLPLSRVASRLSEEFIDAIADFLAEFETIMDAVEHNGPHFDVPQLAEFTSRLTGYLRQNLSPMTLRDVLGTNPDNPQD